MRKMLTKKEIKTLLEECLIEIDSSDIEEKNDLQDNYLIIGNDKYDSFNLVTLFILFEEKLEKKLGKSRDIISKIMSERSEHKTADDICDEAMKIINENK